MDVTATPNLISFRRWCRSAIDHRRHFIDTGQCAIGTGGQLGGDGDSRAFVFTEAGEVAVLALTATRLVSRE